MRAGHRVAASILGGLVAFGVAMAWAPWQLAALVAWDTTAVMVLGWIFAGIAGTTTAETEAHALRDDPSRAAADLLVLSASVASLVGVGAGLVKAAHEHGAGKAWITAIAVLTVVLSWAAVHAVYTLHYARMFFTRPRGGIDFGDEPPDYRDFVYLAFTIGMTYQVSDTPFKTSAGRRMALRHALLSYLFGTVIVAMMINVVAGLLK